MAFCSDQFLKLALNYLHAKQEKICNGSSEYDTLSARFSQGHPNKRYDEVK